MARRSFVKGVTSLLLAVAPFGCSDDDSAPAIPDFQRPFDGKTKVEIVSSLVLPEQFDTFILGSRALTAGPLATLATQTGAVHDADPFLEFLGVEGEEHARSTLDPQVTLTSVSPVELAPTLVTIDPIQPLSESEFAFAMEVGHSVSKSDLVDPNQLLALLKQNSRYVSRLGTLPGVQDNRKIGRLLTPRVRNGSLVVGVVRDKKAAEPGQLAISVLNRRQKWLMESQPIDSRQPAIRSVNLFKESRPALLLQPGGSASFEVTLGEGPATFDFALAMTMARPESKVVLEVSAHCGELSRRAPFEARSDATSWDRLSFDLADLAGQRVRMELRVTAPEGTSDQAILAIGSPSIATAVESPLRDVILISLDTMRADHTSVFGYAKPTTPNLERLAKRAVAFSRANSTAPWTLPSHTSILSGLNVDRHGTHSFTGHVPTDIPWLAREFAQAGYQTLAFTGGGFVSPEFGFATGFDAYSELDPQHPGMEWIEATGNSSERSLAQQSERLREEIARLLSGPRSSPRFLFLHTYAAHDYRTPPSLLKRLGSKDSEIPALVAAISSTTAQALVAENSDPTTLDARLAAVTQIYDGSIALADQLVGTVLDALETAGRLDRTIIVVTSDHGEELLDHGAVGHGATLYQEQIHVPFLIHAPGHNAGRFDDVVSNIDIAPTLRELAGLKAVSECDGRSLVPRLRGESIEPVPALARGSHRDRVYRAMLGTQYKIITEIDSQLQSKRQLFDLVADPKERSDLAAKRQELAEELASRLAERTAQAQAQAKRSQSTEINPELDQRLNELGYTGRDGD